jgi:hypothetical protein
MAQIPKSVPPDPDAWRKYRDPLSIPPHRCGTCGKNIRDDCPTMLADGTRFCSAACYEHYVRR